MHSTEDDVVLVDQDGSSIGSMPKAAVHSTTTPLHLAFSCLIFRDDDDVLVTRRSLSKKTWPGVWTGSCCGHPRPGEAMEAAIERRVAFELGCGITDLMCVDPAFRYRAVSAEGYVENEICPVYTARVSGTPTPNPDEVMDLRWARWSDLKLVATTTPFLLSPWFEMQLRRELVRTS